MNLNQIYAGNDYAYYPYYMPRGTKFHRGSQRVRAVRAFKKHVAGNTNATGFVEVLRIDEEGEIKSEHTMEIRAREILSTWDEHADEAERRRVQEAAREREYQERRERAEVERQRIEAARMAEQQAFYSNLDALGIPRDKVHLSGENVYVNKQTFMEMLNELRKQGSQTRDGQPTSVLERGRTL